MWGNIVVTLGLSWGNMRVTERSYWEFGRRLQGFGFQGSGLLRLGGWGFARVRRFWISGFGCCRVGGLRARV